MAEMRQVGLQYVFNTDYYLMKLLSILVCKQSGYIFHSKYPYANRSFHANELSNILNMLPKPYIILGAFNAHHTLWNSQLNTGRGIKIEKMLLIPTTDLICINKKQNTHENLSNGKQSAIDLTFTSANIATKFESNVLEDLCGSDHFPIVVKCSQLN